MKISNKVKLFRGGVLVLSVVLIAFAISIFASNQAKAEASDSGSNGNLIITTDFTSVSEVYQYNCESQWHVEGGSGQPYILGPADIPFDINSNFVEGHTLTKMECFIDASNYVNITIYDNSNNLKKLKFCFWGYSSKGTWKLNGSAITTTTTTITDFSTDYTFLFEKNPVTSFEIFGYVTTTENEATPIEGALAKYYKQGGGEVSEKEAYTDADGYFIIEDININDAPGFLEITHDNFEKIIVNITYEMAEEEGSVYLEQIQLPPETEKDAEFTAKGLEHHKTFHCVVTFTEGSEQETAALDLVEITSEVIALKVGSTYWLDESGILNVHYEDLESDYQAAIQPVGEDGYIVDKWNSNGVDLVVGEVHEVTTADPIDNLVSYKVAEANPQTGDSLPLAVVAISIIALLAGGLMLRKSFK